MSPVIDFHAHIFPDPLNPIDRLLPKQARPALAQLRRTARYAVRPFTHSIHKTQTFLRHLPEVLRNPMDEVLGLAPLAMLAIESTVEDLKEGMLECGVDYALIIAHPPFIPNELILEEARKDPSLIPVVSIPRGLSKPGHILKRYYEEGARVLKIHSAADGDHPSAPRYKALLRTAAELQMPVIIHTGCFHSHILFKDPEQGHARRFAPWFKSYPETKFILAHMNFHEPQVAFDLAGENPNVLVDTSWQPAEIIGEAARRIGAERVLFGTDWPFLGNSLSVGMHRVKECHEAGTLTFEQSELILGGNAAKLLGITRNAKPLTPHAD